MSATISAREDHVMSWSSYAGGNLSGIGGPVNSSKSARRKQRQREIELGLAAGSIDEGSATFTKPVVELEGCVPLGENGTPPMNVEYEIMRWSELNPQQAGDQLQPPQRPATAYSDDVNTPMSVERMSWAFR